jgi:hypothetical protein
MGFIANEKIPTDEKQSLEDASAPQVVGGENIPSKRWSLQSTFTKITAFLMSWGIETHG